MKLARLAVIAAVAAVLTGCSAEDKAQIRRLALPEPAGDRTEAMYHVWVGAWVASAAVALLVVGLMFWAIVRYRRRSDDEVPHQLRYHLPLEVLYTVAPLIVVAVFFYHTVVGQNTMLEEVDNPDHTIEVVGSKWQWTFNYLDAPAAGDQTVFDQGDTENLPELYLPLGESVRFELVSPDVIHSFWIPEFYFKLDVVPGRKNSFDVTPTREGTFTGRCAELCGVYHSRMLFTVHVVSPAEFERHLAGLVEAGQVGRPQGPENADSVAGLESSEDGGH